MEFWPADFRTNVSSASSQKKRKGQAVYVNEQSFEPGSLGAATLTSDGGRLEWITAVQPRRTHIPRVVGKVLEVFPPTRPPLPSLPRLSIHQRAEQGTRFLRTYHPDVDVPFELIKDELQSDEEEVAADSFLDPYNGNRLVHSSFENKRKQNIHFLAFPSGETGSDLNVSPFRVARDKQLVFSPSATSALSFNTPIQQIVVVSSRHEALPSSSLIAVRTHSIVSIVSIQESSAVHLERPSLTATIVTSISLSDTERHRVVDVSGALFSSSDAQALLINDIGAVFNCKVEGGEKTTVIPSNSWNSELSETDQFWRVVRRDANIGMRSSSKKVQLFDLRSRTALSLVLFNLREEKEFLTSIEAPLSGRHLMCFSTTNKLVWIDERNPMGPVLSLKHQRAFDRTLLVDTLNFGPSPVTMLSSSANSLVTVYDVNYDPSGYIYTYGGPSMVAGSPSVALPLAGFASFRHSAEERPIFDIFRLSSRGSLWRSKIAFGDSDISAAQESSETPEWTADTRALAAKSKAVSEEISPLGGREYLDANLRGAYQKIFQMHQTSETPETDPGSVYQTLERMPFFWQDMDGPAEHMLLTFDVAFQSGVEPFHASRADFLTESLLSSPQGFVALTGERVPIPRLISTVQWHHDLVSLPSHMIPNVATRSRALINQLREEALAHAATAEGMKRAIEATQHVALDLALSRHVYAPQSFSAKEATSNNEVDDSSLLSQATQAMSLRVSKPPHIQFGFLRPVTRLPYDEDEEMGSSDESNTVNVELPLVVRLLLSQWEVGTDPQKYVYNDLYEDSEADFVSQTPVPAKNVVHPNTQTQQLTVPPVTNSQRVPPVVVSTSRPLETTGHLPRTSSMFELGDRPNTLSNNMRPTSSQGLNRPSTHVFSSQEQGPSTQPLPGAFGGGNKQQRKSGKKRMGGF